MSIKKAILKRSFLYSLTLGQCVMSHTTAAGELNPKDLLSLSLKQLTDIEVTSVSKKSEKASEASAAVYVITQEDIQRSGLTSIPEILRMAPGLNVAQAGSRQWAISSRGFNDQFANKLLVLIDGRTVYTPLFSGVQWDVQDTMIEDIDRIEVIRGPGATLWGSNAVNGVINIITKKAKDTQGGIAVARSGNHELGAGSLRYGSKTDEDTSYRIYGKYFANDDTQTVSGADSRDHWSKGQTGFRVDWEGERKQTSLQGEVYQGKESEAVSLPTLTTPFLQSVYSNQNISGGHVMLKLAERLNEKQDYSLQAYIDRVHRNNFYYEETTDTLDLDFQHSHLLNAYNEAMWGVGYRMVKNNVDGTFYLTYSPATRTDNLYSFFVQDKVSVIPEKLFLTLGTKLEANDYSGFEYQPSGRISWLIDPRNTFWASASRAVRTPNRSMDNLSLISSTLSSVPAFIKLNGDTHADSEELWAFEMGYRTQWTERLSTDLALFRNHYDNLVTNQTGSATTGSGGGFGTFVVIPVTPVNLGKGRTWGIEMANTWQVDNAWKMTANYTLLQLDLSGGDSSFVTTEGKSPEHQFSLRSSYNISNTLEFDAMAYYVNDIKPTATISIPQYTRLDLRLGWKPLQDMELSVVGQNLLDDRHGEFSPFIYNNQAQIGRSFYGQVKWIF